MRNSHQLAGGTCRLIERLRSVAGALIVAGALVVAAGNDAIAITLIDFDGASAPCAFFNTVAVRTEFTALGVTFSAPGNDGGAILNECGNFSVTGHSSPNFLAFNAAFLANGGVARAPETLLFSTTVSQLALKAGSSGSGTLTAQAFDINDQLLGTASLPLAPALGGISFNFAGIAKVVLTHSNASHQFVIDDLSFIPFEQDSYKCYQGKDLKNPKFDKLTATTADQIVANENVDVQKIKFICAPVELNGDPVFDANAHLICYQVKGANLAARPKVQVSSQLQISQFELKKPKLLCVPGTKTPIS